MTKKSRAARFIVLESDVTDKVVDVGRVHTALDPERRKLVTVDDDDFPTATEFAAWSDVMDNAVALVLRPDGSLAVALDRARAVNGAWVEDAFVQALRGHDSHS